MRIRPRFEAALQLCRQITAHAPHCRVILTVYEMKRLGREATDMLSGNVATRDAGSGAGIGAGRNGPVLALISRLPLDDL